jgi:hypothetical protein
MSVDANPILAGAIPAFEMFMTSWERLAAKHPRLKPWIDVGLDWATTYYSRMDLTTSYIIAMGRCRVPHTFFVLTYNISS